MAESPIVQRIRDIVRPIASDLGLDLYDLEQRGGTMRITLDTPPGSPSGVDLDQLALATRLISREMDHQDPVPGKYTLEVTSPGVERTLRTAAHFGREIGKTVAIRLSDPDAAQRRFEGVLVAADDTTATIRIDGDTDLTERVIPFDGIDRARTVFVWGPQDKPGSPTSKRTSKATSTSTTTSGTAPSGTATSDTAPSGTAASGTAPSGTAASGTATTGHPPADTSPQDSNTEHSKQQKESS